MQTYFLYQFNDSTYQQVFLKAPIREYLKQAKIVTDKLEEVVCRWVVKKKR